MMSLKVNIPLEEALDLGWEILRDCFSPEETGMKKSMIDTYWPDTYENKIHSS
jgi:V/A-type H+-transporting ATPase subunit B